MNLQSALVSLWLGVVATATLDLWAWCLHRVWGLPVTNWGHVGRWIAHLPSGIYRSEPISAACEVRFERAIGWSAHYLIGVAYASIYLAVLSVLSQAPGVVSALIFGGATVLAPWLILQPGLGIGLFASRAPKPKLTRSLNLLAHLVFGFGLYIAWTAMLLTGV